MPWCQRDERSERRQNAGRPSKLKTTQRGRDMLVTQPARVAGKKPCDVNSTAPPTCGNLNNQTQSVCCATSSTEAHADLVARIPVFRAERTC